MTERSALLVATGLHLALFLTLSLELGRRLPPKFAEPDITPVEFVTIADQPTTSEPPKPSIEAVPQEAEPPAPVPEPAPEPAPAPPTPVPEPAPAPKPVVKDVVADVPPPKAKPAPPKPKPAPKPAFDAGALATLIDKSKPAAPAKPSDVSKFATSIEKAIPKNARLSAIQAATLEQAIRAQIAPCWNPPLGGADVAEMTAVLRIRLNRDGTIAAPPEFVSQTGATRANQAYAQAFVDSAKRAVLRCTPLQLPDNLYSYWNEFELNFDPRLMT